VEAIALAHDLGHTPFGHAGQDALNACMTPFGGFEHNLQSLRVVDVLETRYPQFDGLNLTFETREGILKHCSRANAQALIAQEPGGVAQRFLERTQPSLEAQLCNLADEIAYNAHDIDDGVRSGLITMAQLEEVPLFESHRRATLAQYPHLGDASQGRRLLYETIRRMLSQQVYDVIEASAAALRLAAPAHADAARLLPPMVGFSSAMREQSQVLKSFLLRNLYRHPQVMHTTGQAQQVIADLFAAYMDAPHTMPARPAPIHGDQPEVSVARQVADYIAGMTDRFASREHARITGLQLLA